MLIPAVQGTVVQVAAGGNNSAARTDSGKLYTWGMLHNHNKNNFFFYFYLPENIHLCIKIKGMTKHGQLGYYIHKEQKHPTPREVDKLPAGSYFFCLFHCLNLMKSL